MIFLLTRPMRGATCVFNFFENFAAISTHTPHAGRDSRRDNCTGSRNDFYSHAPCGARPPRPLVRHWVVYFYSHAPCGARRNRWGHRCTLTCISTHTPHAGRDDRQVLHVLKKIQFLLTRPMRGATCDQAIAAAYVAISTHTPHAGRDSYI